MGKITALDVSKNPALISLQCFNNKLNQAAMSNLLHGLPNRKGKSKGDTYVYKISGGVTEDNFKPVGDIITEATNKNWRITTN